MRKNPGEEGETPQSMTLESDVFNAISDVLTKHTPGSMTLKFVCIVETVEPDGSRALYTMAGPDVRAWETSGMLQHALHIQAGETMARTWHAMTEDGEDGE